MGYFSDGFFTGMLASVRETGRRFKNGAKELVEDFISGFNGHGWKLWKRGDSWRLELDELLVRKSFQVFELIINQITAIKGSQAITQGHAKIKEVTIVESADVYKEVATDPNFYYNSNKWRNPYQTGDIPEVVATTDTISTTGAVTEAQAWVVGKGTVIPAKTVQVTVKSTVAMMRYTYSDSVGVNRIIEITESGTYDLPESTGKLADNGFFFDTGFDGEIKQTLLPIETTEEIVQEPCYRIQIDDELNSIVEYDLIRCQKGDKFYYVQVGSVFQYYINIPTSEFEANEEGVVLNAPASGDEIVQFGNASHQDKYANRHSAIYLHVDEDEPAIDLMTDVYSKDWSEGNILKTRLGGNLPGTDGDRGFYCVNGKLLFVDENGDTVSVINTDGSASFARGQISWTKDGNPYFRGYIMSGDSKGQRIEIRPDTASIEVYDKNSKLVNSIEGNKYQSVGDFFNEGDGGYTIKTSVKRTESTPTGGTINQGYAWTLLTAPEPGFQVDDRTTVLTLIAHLTIRFSNFSQGTGYVEARFRIQRKSDGLYNTLVTEKYNINSSITLSPLQVAVILPANDYYIPEIVFYYNLTANASQVVSASISAEIEQANFRIVQYKSSFFSRGLGFGDRAENSLMMWYEDKGEYDGDIHFEIQQPRSGFRIDEESISLMSSNTYMISSSQLIPYALIPHLLIHAEVYISSLNFSIEATSFIGYPNPKLVKTGVGRYQLIFDEKYHSSIFNSTYAYIIPTDVSSNVCQGVCYVGGRTMEIYLKKNNVFADFNFFFDWYYVPRSCSQKVTPASTKTAEASNLSMTRSSVRNDRIFSKEEDDIIDVDGIL